MVLLDCWLHTQTDSIYFLIVTIVLFIQRNITIMFWIFKLLIISINIIQKKNENLENVITNMYVVNFLRNSNCDSITNLNFCT
jgi:hypothetical protein